jgi:hypothetical protein
LNSTEIRRRFTDCFVERNHRPVPSSPLIPYDWLVAERLPDASTDALDVLTGGGKGSMG